MGRTQVLRGVSALPFRVVGLAGEHRRRLFAFLAFVHGSSTWNLRQKTGNRREAWRCLQGRSLGPRLEGKPPARRVCTESRAFLLWPPAVPTGPRPACCPVSVKAETLSVNAGTRAPIRDGSRDRQKLSRSLGRGRTSGAGVADH